MNEQKKKKRNLLWITLLVVLVLGVIGNLLPEDESSSPSTQTETTQHDDAINSDDNLTTDAEHESTLSDQTAPEDDIKNMPFSVTMLDVGQGLSILICSDNHYMLYDGGGRKSSSFVVSYLRNSGVSELDYMIASHYDEDHISGLIGVLNTTTVKKAFIPDYVASSKTYFSFIKKLETSGTNYDYPRIGQTFSLGNASFQILGPDHYDYDDDNDSSISIRVQYGSSSCILTGDSTETAERKIITSNQYLASDIYVVGHHGSATSSSEAFLNAISPKYAFISVGNDNKYGHPTKRVLISLKNHNAEVFRTDLQGTVTGFSNGKEWRFSVNPVSGESADTIPSRSIGASSTENNSSVESTYILNTHTKKYHYPDCSSIKSIKEQNKKTIKASPAQLESQGYSPCGNCKP